MGASTPGIVPLALGRAHELAGRHPDAQRAAWRAATMAFACAQALGGYTLSYLLARTGGDYALLFELGAGSLLLALLVDVVASRRRRGADAARPLPGGRRDDTMVAATPSSNSKSLPLGRYSRPFQKYPSSGGPGERDV